MQMVYNSENFAVVQFDVPGAADNASSPSTGGGFEIVDKFARREIFIEGVMAASFRQGVQALIDTSPSEEDFDEYLGRYVALMQQPLSLH
jgi:hypothetical protein